MSGTQPLDPDLVPNDDANVSTIRTYLGQQAAKNIFNYSLDFDGIGIDTLPLELLSFTQLQHLSLKENQLRGITIDLNLLKELRTLWFDNNPLEELPTDFNPPSLGLLSLPPTTKNPETLSPTVKVIGMNPTTLSERDWQLVQDLLLQME
jgi:hypothetical protein